MQPINDFEGARKMIPDPEKTSNLQPLAVLGLDQFEIGLLSVARYFLAAHKAPVTQSWTFATSIAIERWEEAVGLAVAHHLSKYISTVYDFRMRDFEFMDALCPKSRHVATDDEALLLSALHYMRRDQTGSARDAVAALTKGQMDPDIIRAGLSFAARFPASETPRQNRPALRVVS